MFVQLSSVCLKLKIFVITELTNLYSSGNIDTGPAMASNHFVGVLNISWFLLTWGEATYLTQESNSPNKIFKKLILNFSA